MLHALVCMSSLCLHALCNLHVSFSPYFSPKVLEVGPASFLQIHALARDLTRCRPSLAPLLDSLASAKLRLSHIKPLPHNAVISPSHLINLQSSGPNGDTLCITTALAICVVK